MYLARLNCIHATNAPFALWCNAFFSGSATFWNNLARRKEHSAAAVIEIVLFFFPKQKRIKPQGKMLSWLMERNGPGVHQRRRRTDGKVFPHTEQQRQHYLWWKSSVEWLCTLNTNHGRMRNGSRGWCQGCGGKCAIWEKSADGVWNIVSVLSRVWRREICSDPPAFLPLFQGWMKAIFELSTNAWVNNRLNTTKRAADSPWAGRWKVNQMENHLL